MKKALKVILILSITILFMVGCVGKQESDNTFDGENANLTDSITNEEAEGSDVLTLLELKALLETSNAIEVKNTDNQIIGKINTGEKINKVIEDVFNLTVVDNYEYSPDENVTAIINFYPSGNDPIYGLIKEKFIYIEGYYFTSKNNSIQKIIDYFRVNTEEEPIVGD